MYNTVELPTKHSVGVKPKLQWKPLEDAGNVECLLMKALGSGCSKTREKPRGRKGYPSPLKLDHTIMPPQDWIWLYRL